MPRCHLGALLRPQRPLVALFLLLTLLPSVLLVALGWRTLTQERALAEERLRQQREEMADLAVDSLEQSLTTVERALQDPDAVETLAAADDSVAVVFDDGGVRAFPGRRLAFYPVSSPGVEPLDQVFDEGETLEYTRDDPVAAARSYRALTHSRDDATRAGALIRLARVQKTLGQAHKALATYGRAAALSGVILHGEPIELVARWARCDLLARLDRPQQLAEEASGLSADLAASKWVLDRASYESLEEDLGRWLALGGRQRDTGNRSRIALSTVVDRLWNSWQKGNADGRPGSGADVETVDGVQWTVLWQQHGDRLAALVAGPSSVDKRWLRPLAPMFERQGLRIALRNPAAPLESAYESRRPASETGLPWTVAVAHQNPQIALDRWRSTWLAGLALLSVVVIGVTVIVGWAIMRAMEVARLQSDFVAAVSHEFRTPLTSLRQVTESLTDGRVAEVRRAAYYQVLSRQTDRLHRLVESLLDFGRMEAGRSPYRLEPVDARGFVTEVVRQFEDEVMSRGYRVQTSLGTAAPTIAADPEALTTAVWNLLDNAVKYSPVCPSVWIDMEAGEGQVEIRVRDQGLGIPREEQADIFQKFVRGAGAKNFGIKGTGIGLAIVRHIIAAHGGRVSVVSEPGVGSTFTITIPTCEVVASHPESAV